MLRCCAMFLKPLKYKNFRRISCFLVLLGSVLFFRLFWHPVSKMLAETRRKTNTNELWFESKPWFHATTLIGKLYEKDNFASIHDPSRENVKKRYASPATATRMHTALFYSQPSFQWKPSDQRRISFPDNSPYSGVASPKPPDTLRTCPVV